MPVHAADSLLTGRCWGELLIRAFPNLGHNSGGSRIPKPVSINYLSIIYENSEFAEPTGNGLHLKIVSFL